MSAKYPMIRVKFHIDYIGPDVPGMEGFLRGNLRNDLNSYSVADNIETERYADDPGDVPDWVWEQMSIPCPHLDEEGHGPECLVCEGDETYFPGWKPIDDGEPGECIHEPEAHTVTYSGEQFICDVACMHCGLSGSFTIDPGDINWS